MKKLSKHIIYSIASIFIGAMFFSCTNNAKEVRDLLKQENRPIGEARNINHIYKDSGRITNKLKTSLLYDYSNRKEHPYNEFPKGLEIVIISKDGKDSTKIRGNYAIVYNKTNVAEIKGDVVITNYTKNVKLETNQLFWSQNRSYVFTEEGFRLTTSQSVINGFGFEAKQDLTKWQAKDITGSGEVKVD